MKALDLALVGRADVPEEHSRHEDGEEAGAVRERGHAVQDAGEREREDRIERLVREIDPAHRFPQHDRAEDAECEADRHLGDELEGNAPERRVVVRRELERADHQRDGDGVVHARLAEERRARTPADLLAAEHGEHHRRVGGGECRAEDGCDRPADVQRGVRKQRDEQGRAERAEDAEERDLGPGAAEPAPADVHPTLEEDDDEGHDAYARRRLDRHDRQAREHVAGDGGDDQEDRRPGNREPRAELAGGHGHEQPTGHDEDDSAEVEDLGHDRG